MKGRKAQKGLNQHTSKLSHLREHCLEADSNFSTDCKKGSDLADAVAGRWVPQAAGVAPYRGWLAVLTTGPHCSVWTDRSEAALMTHTTTAALTDQPWLP